MKQTLEEAAEECRRTVAQSMGVYAQYHSINECPNHGLSYDELVENAFMKGANWQAKQSPWISVEDALPPKCVDVLVMEVRGNYHNFGIAWCDNNPNGAIQWYSEDENLGKEFIRYWMRIPAFEDILEANRDVLKRMKEKGD